MKKVLFIANSDRHILLCHLPYLKMFKDNGYLIHVATNSNNKIEYCDKKINLHMKRRPFHLLNIKSLFLVRKLLKKEKYDIISCHTPMGGFLGRCAVIGMKNKPKVFYTAHGFHFYKGVSFINWIVYYPIELFLSKYTTCLLTMNEEDYKIAKLKFKCPVYKINGIGYDKNRLKKTKKTSQIKKELEIKNEFVVTYIAEISKRKRQKELIKALSKYDLKKENIKVILIGDSIIKSFDKFVKDYPNIKYIGFKNNVGDYLNVSDLVISASIQEGLPLNIIEALSLNKMVIATNIRGNNDLINDNGILVDKNNLELLVKEIISYKNNPKNSINNDMKKYKYENIIREVKVIYNQYLDNELK